MRLTVRCTSMEPAKPHDRITTHAPSRTLGISNTKRTATARCPEGHNKQAGAPHEAETRTAGHELRKPTIATVRGTTPDHPATAWLGKPSECDAKAGTQPNSHRTSALGTPSTSSGVRGHLSAKPRQKGHKNAHTWIKNQHRVRICGLLALPTQMRDEI